ncbi:MAG TPA: GvpL/GvpF family gas vesicle protein, partial [Solirubrobacteraceae bacterium]
MIALYAITDHPGPPLPDLAPLQAVASRGLAAVWAPAPEGEVTADMLWRHERVVEALMDRRDVLPIRYGTRVSDEAAAAEAIEANHERLLKSLEFVRGAAEVAVRALTTDRRAAPMDPAGASTGAEYLRARAHELAAQAEAAR